jgi:IPT/TIG domain-containing protein
MGQSRSIFSLPRFLQSVLVVCVLTIPFAFAGSGENTPVFAGVSLSVASPTVPPGGLLQMQVFVTEPNPILKGKQKMAMVPATLVALSPLGTISGALTPVTAPLGAIRDAGLFSPGGDVSGVAVGKTGATQVFFTSPLTTFGTTIDTPVMALAIPVAAGATVGQTVNLNLDPNNSLWYDPNSKLYPVELKSGILTVGGTLSISDVNPGAGTVQPGTVISIKGVGFQPTSQVDINEAVIATSQYVSANLMQVTLSLPLDIRGKRIRVTNSNNEKAEYYPYQRTTRLGSSTHALVASSIPLFAQTTWTLGFFRPTLQGTIFSGLALQNLNAVKANVVLRLYSKTAVLLSTQKVVLGVNVSMARDLAELFPGVVAATGTKLKVSSDQPIQMLGLLGDDSTGTLLPINPTSTP